MGGDCPTSPSIAAIIPPFRVSKTHATTGHNWDKSAHTWFRSLDMRTHITIPEEMIAEIDSFVGPRKRREFFEAEAAEQLRRLRLVRVS